MPQTRSASPASSPKTPEARSLAPAGHPLPTGRFQPYVAQRRSPKHRIMVLDLEPGGFASLVLGHPSGDATVYELCLEGGAVRLTVKYPGRETKTLCIDPLPETEVSRG